MKKNKRVKGSFLKGIFIEIRDTILFEVVWWILTLIPRLMIRFIKNIL
ncbi:hypothetical protein [Bacillus taeanensis]|nr:hypothetical protein [Bacillus taeanensis]